MLQPSRDVILVAAVARLGSPLSHIVNYAHLTGIAPGLTDGDWAKSLGGFLPYAVALDLLALCSLGRLEDGDPVELGGQAAELAGRYTHVHAWGGCCGPDGRHIDQIARHV